MANVNFAVACNGKEEIVKKGNELLDKIQKRTVIQEDGTVVQQDVMKRCEALDTIFDIASSNLERVALKHEGVDVEALDAAFDAIRSQFTSVSKGREQIRLDCESKIAVEKESASKQAKTLQEKIDTLTAARDEAKQTAEITTKAAAEAEKDRLAAEKQAETANKLAEEKTRTVDTLSAQLTESKAKADEYDAIKAEREKRNAVLESQVALMERVNDLTQQIAELRAQLQQ